MPSRIKIHTYVLDLLSRFLGMHAPDSACEGLGNYLASSIRCARQEKKKKKLQWSVYLPLGLGVE